MKHFFLILFSLLSFAVLSQAAPTSKIKVNKSKFVKSKTLQQLIPSIPKECAITGYQFAIDSPQLKKTIPIKGNKISTDLKSIVKNMKAGQKFYIENVKSDCKKDFKRKYIFIIS